MKRRLHWMLLCLFALGCAEYVLDLPAAVPPTGEPEDAGVPLADAGLDASVVVPDASVKPEPEPKDAGVDEGFQAGVCSDQGRKIFLSALDLLIALDVSYSMDYDGKWPAVKSAFKSFFSRPESSGLGVGLQFFPLRAQCSLEAYRNPAVPLGLLPAVGPALTTALDYQQLSGGTPTVRVMEGVTQYARSWLALHPERIVAVVLATDGVPDTTCAGQTDGGLPNSLANVLTVAGGAAQASPPVRTFVIGVGQDLSALNQIAAAGGTGSAVLVEATTNADVVFLEALTKIRRDARGCTFDVPEGSLGKPLTTARVRFTPDDGTASFRVSRVTDEQGCVEGAGWFFDDNEVPKKLKLCDQSCEDVVNKRTGQLYVEFACDVG